MGIGMKHGASAPILNFKVVGGTTQPENPSENTLWVNTAALSSYIFAPEAPELPAEGMVWFALGNSSTASFNALKKNALILCPLYARQYRSGAWEEVQAKTFLNGAWADWSPMSVVIFENGEFTSGSFGYVLESESSYSRVEIADGFWKIVCSGSGTVYGYTTEAFDLTNISELIFTGEVESGDSSYKSTITFGVASAQEDTEFVAKQSFSTWGAVNSDAYAVDVSSLSGRYYIKAMVERSAVSYYHNLNISDIRSA